MSFDDDNRDRGHVAQLDNPIKRLRAEQQAAYAHAIVALNAFLSAEPEDVVDAHNDHLRAQAAHRRATERLNQALRNLAS